MTPEQHARSKQAFLLACELPREERAAKLAELCGGDAAVKQATDAGATVLVPSQDMFWGDRYAVVIDPFGHQWALATHIKDLTAEEMEAGVASCFQES